MLTLGLAASEAPAVRALDPFGTGEELESVHVNVLSSEDGAQLNAVLEASSLSYLRIDRPDELAVVVLTPTQPEQLLDDELDAAGLSFESMDLPLDMFIGTSPGLPDVIATYVVGTPSSEEAIEDPPDDPSMVQKCTCGPGVDALLSIHHYPPPPSNGVTVYKCLCGSGRHIKWTVVEW